MDNFTILDIRDGKIVKCMIMLTKELEKLEEL